MEERKHEKRNFASLVASQVVFGLGWLFKTESVVIPSAMTALGATDTELMLFPATNRLGSFVPQILFARMLATRKRRLPLFIATRLLFACFWIAAGFLVWRRGSPGARGVFWVFFALYALGMFTRSGAMVANSSLRGKLVRSDLRGRLVGTQQFIDGLVRTAVSILLVRPLLARTREDPRIFGLAFLASAALFMMAVVPALLIKEHEGTPQKGRSFAAYARRSFGLLREPDFRRAVFVRLIHGTAFVMLPIYAKYGMRSTGDSWAGLLGWILAAQALSRAFGGVVMGWLADRCGNRLVIRIVCALLVLWPLYALLAGKMAASRPFVYVTVYLVLGLLLPGGAATTNYVLELSPPERHPDYIGVMNTSLLLGVPAAILAGVLCDLLGHEVILLALAVLALPAVLISLRLREPRERLRAEVELPLA